MTRIRHIRASSRYDRGVDKPLATPHLAGKPLSRSCPKCEAEPGKPCRRWIGGRIGGEDVGGGYWRPLKKVHDERRRSRGREAGQ